MSQLIHSEAEYVASPHAPPASEMTASEYQKLVRSIGSDGLYVPIVLYQGAVLEGRQRYRACIETGVTPEFREYGIDPKDGEDPRTWALAHSSHGLSAEERDRLAICEHTIEQGLTTFVAVGRALLEVRDGRLWREKYDSFEIWAQERFDVGRRHADRMIAATQVVALLGEELPQPRTEAVARELSPLRDQPEELRAIWSDVLQQHGTLPTARQTHEVVTAHMPETSLSSDDPDEEPAISASPPADPASTTTFAPTTPEHADPPNVEDEAPDPKLDNWGDEGRPGVEHAGAIHAVLGFLDQLPELPGAITLAERMSVDQRRRALMTIPTAVKYLDVLARALQTS